MTYVRECCLQASSKCTAFNFRNFGIVAAFKAGAVSCIGQDPVARSPQTENWPHLQLRSQRSLLVDQLAAEDGGCLPPACLSPQAVSISSGSSMWRVASLWWATPRQFAEAKPSDVCARVLPSGFK